MGGASRGEAFDLTNHQQPTTNNQQPTTNPGKEAKLKEKAHSKDLRKGRFSQPGQIYHITSVTFNRKPFFHDLYCGRHLIKTMMNEEKIDSLAYVLMPDHFHWLLTCGENGDICESIHRVKSVSAHRINKHLGRTGKLWQGSFYDQAIRKEENIAHVARYIVANPLRAGLVKSLSDYSLWDAVWV